MLQSLEIRDFVIVRQLELDLSQGFTVLTGETGAGKSILLDALAIAMGEKADISQIREGCSRAQISANFTIPESLKNNIETWLEEFGFTNEDDHQSLQLKRIIENSGRSKSYINGFSATLSQLREIGEQLVDIHGQHEHQLLLKPGAQRQLLDNHAKLTLLLEQVAQAYQNWVSIDKKIKSARALGQNIAKEKERIAWQLEELNTLSPKEGEWIDLEQEHSRLSNAAELINGSQELVNLLSEGENSLLDQISKAQNILKSLVQIDLNLSNIQESLEPADIQINEAAHTINRYLQKLELDPSRLTLVDSRLQEYHRLAKKYKSPPEDLPHLWIRLKEEFANLEASQNIEQLEIELKNAWEAYTQVALKLSSSRKKAAIELSNAVTLTMQTLAMTGGKFVAEVTSIEQGNQYGLDNVEFLVAGHPGVLPRPISKVASGGELARISLAISVIASSASQIPSLIFDEVDSGIGGAVAQTVGELLKQLGQHHQVLCVTHLPQVAAQGDHQLRVQKTQDDEHTVSQIDVLDQQQRVQEIARMLGGTTITETTLQHAKELLGY